MNLNPSRALSLVFAPVRLAAAWSEALGEGIVERLSWTPVEQAVVINIDDSDDDALLNTVACGVVRGVTRGSDGAVGDDLLIELNSAIAYRGQQFDGQFISWLVATPCVGAHRTKSLLLSWAAVRLIDALTFPAATRSRTVGLGRLRLRRRRGDRDATHPPQGAK